jgi:hypothetical protein
MKSFYAAIKANTATVASAAGPGEVETLERDVEPGFDTAEACTEVAVALAARGAFRLRLGRDLGNAVGLLRALTD